MADAMKLVPCEPTEAMTIAGREAAGLIYDRRARDCYAAMISAAPEAQPQDGAIWAKVEATARRYARCYPEASDGRNTFFMFAEWAASEAASPPAREEAPAEVITSAQLIANTDYARGAVRVPGETEDRRIYGQPEAPAEGAGDLETAWRILEAIPAINDLPSQFQEDIQAAILSALRNRTSEPAREAVAWEHRIYGADAKPGPWEPSNGPSDGKTLRPCRIIEYRPAPATADRLKVAKEALELADDVLSRSPMSTQPWITDNGTVHPNTGITIIRTALATLNEKG